MSVESRSFALASWIGVALLGAGVVASALLGSARDVWVFVFFFTLSAIILATEPRLPRLLGLLLVAALVYDAAGWAWDLWARLGPYDEIAHAVTTFAITVTIGWFLYHPLRSRLRRRGALALLALTGLGLLVAGLWELGEAWGRGAGIGRPTTAFDVASDLTASLVGAALGALATPRLLRLPRTRAA